MARQAYLLIKCEQRRLLDAVESIRQIPGVLAVEGVVGLHDTMETADAEDAARMILSDITTAPGVTGTKFSPYHHVI